MKHLMVKNKLVVALRFPTLKVLQMAVTKVMISF